MFSDIIERLLITDKDKESISRQLKENCLDEFIHNDKVIHFLREKGVELNTISKAKLKQMCIFWKIGKKISCQFILEFMEDNNLIIN